MEAGGVLLVLGLVLVAGMAGGVVARLLRLPALTGFLGAGIALGPHGLDLVPHAAVQTLGGPVNDLAMALVLFVLGGQFTLRRLRGSGAALVRLSGLEAAFTFALVAVFSFPVLGSVAGALLLGVMAVAVAPATTLVVLKEYQAKGPITDAVLTLTALSNIWSILAFEAVLLVLVAFSGGEAGPGAVLWDATGSLLYGLVAGHLLIFLRQQSGRDSDTVPLLTVLLLTIGACKLTGVPHMLAFLVTGAVVANRSRVFKPLTGAMDSFSQPAFVAFFVVNGMHLDFGIIQASWLAVGIYALARTVGKVAGARLGMKLGGLRLSQVAGPSGPPIGLGLLCQAGAAIALAGYVSEYDAALGEQLRNIILGAAILFELAGPLLVRHLAVTAGEVPLGRMLVHGTQREEGHPWLGALSWTLQGRRPSLRAHPGAVKVRHLMRPDPVSLPARAGLDEILRFADHSPYHHFPVVDDRGRLTGLIALGDLDRVAYDRRAARLVTASDLAAHSVEKGSLPATATLAESKEFFAHFDGHSAAVVRDRRSRTLVGMVERSEVQRAVHAFEKAHPSSLAKGPPT
jgi:Kef-type K+ transport system membrane component KefB/CBS domain-containing protein